MSVQQPKIFNVKPNIQGVKLHKTEPVVAVAADDTEDLDAIGSKVFDNSSKTKEETVDEQGKIKIGSSYFSTTVIFIFAIIVVVLIGLIVYLCCYSNNNKQQEEVIKNKIKPPPIISQPLQKPKPSDEEIKRSNEILDDMLNKLDAGPQNVSGLSTFQNVELPDKILAPSSSKMHIEEVKNDAASPKVSAVSPKVSAISPDEQISKMEKLFHDRLNEEAIDYDD
jgi:hypothetical protein